MDEHIEGYPIPGPPLKVEVDCLGSNGLDVENGGFIWGSLSSGPPSSGANPSVWMQAQHQNSRPTLSPENQASPSQGIRWAEDDDPMFAVEGLVDAGQPTLNQHGAGFSPLFEEGRGPTPTDCLHTTVTSSSLSPPASYAPPPSSLPISDSPPTRSFSSPKMTSISSPCGSLRQQFAEHLFVGSSGGVYSPSPTHASLSPAPSPVPHATPSPQRGRFQASHSGGSLSDQHSLLKGLLSSPPNPLTQLTPAPSGAWDLDQNRLGSSAPPSRQHHHSTSLSCSLPTNPGDWLLRRQHQSLSPAGAPRHPSPHHAPGSPFPGTRTAVLLMTGGGMVSPHSGSPSSLSPATAASPPTMGDRDTGSFLASDEEAALDSSDDESTVGSIADARGGKGSSSRPFWMYNVQSKGPKGQKLMPGQPGVGDVNPYYVESPVDPVFDPDVSGNVEGIRHSGKARRGDGNDLTPDPKKLLDIGRKLDKLTETINDMTPPAELPSQDRPQIRKDKNKLASKQCRLKKKAQHEALKIQNYALTYEQSRLLASVAEIRKRLLNHVERACEGTSSGLDLEAIEREASSCRGVNIAGHTVEFVNSTLEKGRLELPK